MSAEFNGHFQRLFTIFMTQLQGMLAPTVNIPMAYDTGSDEEQAFIQNLALFFTAFFRVRLFASADPCFTCGLPFCEDACSGT